MAIPERQLKTWARFIQTDKAKKTHESIRSIIRDYEYSRNYNFEDYLQGSYKNHTNIWADTDVDIVIQLDSVFRSNISNLTEEQRKRHNSHYPNATYGLDDFKIEVLEALYKGFGCSRIKIGNKSIKILSDDANTMYNADVIISMQYRLYVPKEEENTKTDDTGLPYYEGILFKTSLGDEIVNFPKLHYENGKKKHSSTNNLFKPIVRIFKNMRNKAAEKGYLIYKDIAPSYFVQCLLYNVPDYIFCGSYQEIVKDILNWLDRELNDNDNWKNFVSQNEIIPLFGLGDDKWNITYARIFIKSLIEMWENWE